MIFVFDAQCLLCNGWGHFLLRNDHRGVVKFASFQGATGKGLLAQAGLKVDGLQTLLVVDGKRTWQHTQPSCVSFTFWDGHDDSPGGFGRNARGTGAGGWMRFQRFAPQAVGPSTFLSVAVYAQTTHRRRRNGDRGRRLQSLGR